MESQYAGFWLRTLATVIDSLLMLAIIFPLLTLIYGMGYWSENVMVLGVWDVLLNYVIPAIVVIIFWLYRSATPGKMALGIVIVDAKTGDQPSMGQLVGRYFAYYLSIIPFMLGFLWVGWDKRKQGWHDKLAGTVVVRVSKVVSLDDDVRSEIESEAATSTVRD